ncbi:hypothetical protein L8P35_14230 [Enterobacter cloacae]|uniref:hypothetical protein n=1 Tax=Enterobacter cloacae TaxID=550 RepID=UPI0020050B12|nr:hypothetical protein [Enterobacter cloacae]EKG3969986.1 hypothetical protein [Salmonella enterica]ELW4538329.1 hypothetical protein [Salmonella enterica]ELX9053631.1 hypothetical protein [Salmonella enterica]MCK7317856.1 hypothetical protein [Enterobacter cloacae]
MSNRFFVYSLFVPKNVLSKYLGSGSDCISSGNELNLTTEVFFIFDRDSHTTLSFSYRDNISALDKCNEKNRAFGSKEFNFDKYKKSDETIYLEEKVGIGFASDEDDEDTIKNKLTAIESNIKIIIEQFKSISTDIKYSSSRKSSPKLK